MDLLAAPLAGFLRVADLGSVSRAAIALHLSQPAVTKQLRALERGLGMSLVERRGRGIQLTEAGRLLADYGRRSARLFDECVRALEGTRAGTRGTLTIGAGVTTSIFHLPRWLRRFRRERPGVEVIVRTGTSRVVEREVIDRDVDLGFVTSDVAHPDLEAQRLYREQIVLVVARDYHRPRGSGSSQVPLILFPPESGFRRFLDDHLGRERLAGRTRMESDSVEAIKSFVLAGLGGSFLPQPAVAQELRAGSLRRLPIPGQTGLFRHTWLIRRRDRELGASARRFVALAAGSAGEPT